MTSEEQNAPKSPSRGSLIAGAEPAGIMTVLRLCMLRLFVVGSRTAPLTRSLLHGNPGALS